MFELKKQNLIRQELKILIGLIKRGIINQGISQKVQEQRLSQEIETYTNGEIVKEFKNNESKFTYLESINGNNGSTKAPFELKMIFNFNSKKDDIYVDLKPINILKPRTAPFMGSIAKHIKRYQNQKFYDLFLIVEYESEVNKLPILKNVIYYFVKDINNYTLYNNWQLQATIQNINHSYGKVPQTWKKQLLFLLDNLENKGIERMRKRIRKLKMLIE